MRPRPLSPSAIQLLTHPKMTPGKWHFASTSVFQTNQLRKVLDVLSDRGLIRYRTAFNYSVDRSSFWLEPAGEQLRLDLKAACDLGRTGWRPVRYRNRQ